VPLRPCASKRFDPSPTPGARPRLLPAALLGVLAGLSGCAVGPNYHEPKPDMPPKYAAAAAGSSTATTERGSGEAKLAAWWRTLNDLELDSLVDRAIKSNLDLQIALVDGVLDLLGNLEVQGDRA